MMEQKEREREKERDRERKTYNKTRKESQKEVQKRRHVKFNRASYKSNENLWSSLHVCSFVWQALRACRAHILHLTPFGITYEYSFFFFKFTHKTFV